MEVTAESIYTERNAMNAEKAHVGTCGTTNIQGSCVQGNTNIPVSALSVFVDLICVKIIFLVPYLPFLSKC